MPCRNHIFQSDLAALRVHHPGNEAMKILREWISARKGAEELIERRETLYLRVLSRASCTFTFSRRRSLTILLSR